MRLDRFEHAAAGGIDVGVDGVDALGQQRLGLGLRLLRLIPAGDGVGGGDIGAHAARAGEEATVAGLHRGDLATADEAELAGLGQPRGQDADLVGRVRDVEVDGDDAGARDVGAAHRDAGGARRLGRLGGGVEVLVAVGDDQVVAFGGVVAQFVAGLFLRHLLQDRDLGAEGLLDLVEALLGELVPAAVGDRAGAKQGDLELFGGKPGGEDASQGEDAGEAEHGGGLRGDGCCTRPLGECHQRQC